jgi:hypothetical protein
MIRQRLSGLEVNALLKVNGGKIPKQYLDRKNNRLHSDAINILKRLNMRGRWFLDDAPGHDGNGYKPYSTLRQDTDDYIAEINMSDRYGGSLHVWCQTKRPVKAYGGRMIFVNSYVHDDGSTSVVEYAIGRVLLASHQYQALSGGKL